MAIQKFVYYKEDSMYVGHLEEFPDYMTQGETMEELKLNLLDIYKELDIEKLKRASQSILLKN